MEKFLFPAGLGVFKFGGILHEVLFPIFTLTSRVNIYVSCRERVKIGEKNVQI